MGGSRGEMKINYFKEDLVFSEEASEEWFWQEVYQQAFPDMINNIHCTGDNQGQRLGIDRLIYLQSGKVLFIDEKKRRKIYDDILLEYLSNDKTGALGWIEKDLLIDYLAYAFIPNKVCYLFPWHILRRTWIKLGDQWKNDYKKIESENLGYKTISLAIPIMILRKAVSTAAVIQL